MYHWTEEEPSFLETFFPRSLYPGSNLNLRCSASGSPLPQIRWYRYHQLLSSDSSTSRNYHHSSTAKSSSSFRDIRIGDYVSDDGRVIMSHLNLTTVSNEDGGIFSCEAINEVSRIKHSAVIQVYGPPVVLGMPNVSVTSSGKLLLDCPISGFPIESIRWKKGKNWPSLMSSNDISSNHSISSDISSGHHTLRLFFKRDFISLLLHKTVSETKMEDKSTERPQVFNDLSHFQFFIFHVNDDTSCL